MLTPEEKLSMGQWPIYYEQDLIVGNRDSNVGIVTLWTMRKQIADGLDPSSFAVVGNLYSTVGINWIIRNVLANPQIRYLIVCGQDLTKSGEDLVNFFQTRALKQLHPEVDMEAVTAFLDHIELFDMRGTNIPGPIAEKIHTLETRTSFRTPEIFPESKLTVDTSPSENTGFRVEGGNVSETWLQVLHHVMRFGKVKPTEYSTDQKEILNLVSVVTCEHPDQFAFPDYLPYTAKDLENYYPQVLSKDLPDGVNYTYGNRLMDHGGIDQIEKCIVYLKQTWFTRRAAAFTWNVQKDVDNTNPPCLTTLFTSIQDDKVYMTAIFRSHDLYNAWLLNVFALRKLHLRIAKEVGLGFGPLTIISHSAHIYEDKWTDAKEILEKAYPKFLPFYVDHRGMILLSLQEAQIKAVHQTPEGFVTKELFDTTAIGMYKKLANFQLISRPEHYADMGAELQKAEIALKLGLEYKQDKPLDFSSLKDTLCAEPVKEATEVVPATQPTRYVKRGKKMVQVG